MKRMMIVCVVAGLMAASGTVWAQDGGGRGGPAQRGGMKGGGHGPGGIGWLVHNEDVAKSLGVTADQITQLGELAYQGEIAQIKGRADLEIAQMELRRLLDSAKPTEEAVGKAVDKISALEAQLQKARLGEMLKARQILGDDTMDKLRDAAKERMRDRDTKRDRGQRGERRGDRRGMSECEGRPMPPQAPGDDDKDE